MNLIFAGTPSFAVPSLQALIHSQHRVIAVYTQPDRPAGRGQHLRASPVKTLALKHGIPVHQPTTLRDTILPPADRMVVTAYGLLLPPTLLNQVPCINVHASLLPRWRGAAPIPRAILAGDSTTGVTIMQMEAGLDTGPILYQLPCPIEPQDTAESLHDRLAPLGAEALLHWLSAEHRHPPMPQDNGQATYAPKLSKTEALIDWTQSAIHIDRCVRAFQPWPVAHTQFQDKPLRILAGEVGEPSPNSYAPGTIIAATKSGIDVATGEAIFRLKSLQLPGGKPLTAAEFLNAHRQLVGTILQENGVHARNLF